MVFSSQNLDENEQKLLQRKLADSIKKMVPLDDIRILLAEGAKVNEPVVQGLRPLHYAVWQKYTGAVQLLLTRGGDVNALDECGYSAVHLCAECGHTDLLRLLLSAGAKVDYRPHFSTPGAPDEPLRLAVRNRHFDAARILLENGADPNARYFFGAELNFEQNFEFLNLLLSFGADVESRDRRGLTRLMKSVRKGAEAIETTLLLIKYGANVNAITDERNDYRTVLHYAVMSSHYETIDLLIKQGAKLNYDRTNKNFDYEKPSPLDLAILKGDVEIIKLLISSGADVNFSSPILGTPLHVACSENILNRYEILKILLENGANPNLKVYNDSIQLKPVLPEYLSRNCYTADVEVVNLLLKYGARVVMKTQYRDPDGVLNSLQCLKNNENVKIFEKLCEAAESFDFYMIKRSKDLNESQKEILLKYAREPLSLKKIVRLFLRRFDLIKIAPRMELPKILINYLLFN